MTLCASADTAGEFQTQARARPVAALDPWAICALFCLWVFCNPYFAIDRGGLIYAGRALADLDPTGVGQDMMFRLDGQSSFTIFTPIFRLLVAGLGAGPAMMLVGATGMASSFAAAVYFSSKIANGPARVLAIIFAAALPAAYGGYELFSYSETAVTPRPFSESFVLCGFALLLSGRKLAALAAITAAAALHPIMALPGAVVLAAMTMTDRRWAFGWLVLLGCMITLALAGAPPFDRIAQIIDPAWKDVLLERNPHLFVDNWPIDWTGRAATRAATLLIAAGLVTPALRRLILTTLIVGFAGLAASWLLGERLSSLFILQAQTWRMMWLVFALATYAGAICVVELWKRDWISRVALGFLAMGWAFADYDVIAAAFATTAVLIRYTVRQEDLKLPRWVYIAALTAIGAAIAVGLGLSQLAIYRVISSAPPGLALEARRVLALQMDYMPLAALAALWTVLRPAPSRMFLALGCALGLPVVVATWDQRNDANRHFDAGEKFPQMEAVVSSRPGEVFWIDGMRGAWWWLRRPHWVAAVQGAGLVFSRELAMNYQDRAHRAAEAGFADKSLAAPFSSAMKLSQLVLTPEALARFCAPADAPAWIVAPVNDVVRIADGVPKTEVDSPISKVDMRVVNGRFVWWSSARYAVIPCKS